METSLYKSRLKRTDRIGKGSYSVVFKGYRKDDTSKIVAIKRIENDQDFFTENATKDIIALKSVSGHHKNIVKLLDLHSDDEYIYIIMEYCEQGDLEDFLSSGVPPNYEIRLDIMKQCVRGVAYIHGLDKPVVHRDIKLNNILVQNSPTGMKIKLADFGLAKVFDKIDGHVNALFMSTDAGSLAFRAPEMCKIGRIQYNSSVDVYALGLVFTVLMNYDEEEKLLEPQTANEPREPYLPFGMRQLQAHNKNDKMPSLFFKPEVDEKHLQMKSIIIDMTHFDCDQRLSIEHAKERIKQEINHFKEQDIRRAYEADLAEQMNSLRLSYDDTIHKMQHGHQQQCAILERKYSNELRMRTDLVHRMQESGICMNSELQPDLIPKVMVVAIEFGSTNTGYAFSFKTDPQEIKMNKSWQHEIGAVDYTPSSLLLDSSNDCIAFGFDAETRHRNAQAEEDIQDMQLYKQFTHILYEKENINEQTQLISVDGKKTTAMVIYVKALQFLKDHLVKTLNKLCSGPMDEAIIFWVLTLPDDAGYGAVQFMRDAAFRAGYTQHIDATSLLISVESKAVLRLCKTLNTERFIRRSISKKPPPEPTFDNCIVVNLRDNGMILTLHSKFAGQYSTSWHAYGTKMVEDNFTRLLEDVIGVEVISSWRETHNREWNNLLLHFVKHFVRFNERLTLQLPWAFKSCCEQIYSKDISRIIKQRNMPGVTFVNGMLSLNSDVIEELCKPVVSGIATEINNLLAKNEHFKTIIAVGELAMSVLLQQALFKELPLDKCILIPNQADHSIIQGAVLLGHWMINDFYAFVHDSVHGKAEMENITVHKYTLRQENHNMVLKQWLGF